MSAERTFEYYWKPDIGRDGRRFVGAGGNTHFRGVDAGLAEHIQRLSFV